VDAMQAWIVNADPVKANSERLLHTLSLRIQRLTSMLPGSIRVYGTFAEQGPVLQGAHYRYKLNSLAIAHYVSLVTHVRAEPLCES